VPALILAKSKCPAKLLADAIQLSLTPFIQSSFYMTFHQGASAILRMSAVPPEAELSQNAKLFRIEPRAEISIA
jgi:hypothetical protein